MEFENVCNVCGKELDMFDQQEEYTLHKFVGYGSKHDGSVIHLQMCCDCFDRLVDSCAVSPLIGEYEI